MRFRVLGPIEVLVDGVPAHLGGPRPRALLALLVAHAGRVVPTSHLIDQLWEHRPPATAQAALQVHVSTLRKVLGDRVVTVASGYRLDADDVDAWQFEATADLGLWRGQPYCGVTAVPDVEAARVRLTELRLTTVEKRGEAELAIGHHAQVVGELAKVVAEHPMRERLVELLMLAQYRSGRAGDARTTYRTLCDRLTAELGTEPSPRLASLDQAIARRDPTLDPPSAIAMPASRFIGRREELNRLTAKLGEVRLLTLTGPAGVGKTRLALQLARDTAADHDSVHLVELAAVSVGDAVAAAVSGALSGESPSSRVLLVVDNCEHVVDDCAEVISDLLGRHGGLRVVATSREPLGVPGEQVWPVAGLPVPDAIRLLAERGTAAKPGFALNAEVATELCWQLDGLPLAIELAAAQLRTLSLPEVAARLGRRLDLADRRARTSPDRHRTMRAAIGWSHDLLGPDEQALFGRMSVFVGGSVAEAVEQVCGFGPEVLEGLVDRSLVVADHRVDGTRYRMLELVREYAAEQLADSGDADLLRSRHANWLADLVEGTPWAGPDPRWLRRLVDEVPNLRAAIEWGLEFDAECALRIVAALWQFWWPHGLGPQARHWLRQGLASAPESVPLSLRAKALRAAATMAQSDGDHDEAREFDELALAAFRELGDNENVALTLLGLSWSATNEGRLADALTLIEEGARAAELAGSDIYLASALSFKATTLRALGRNAEATELFTRAYELHQKLGEQGGMAVALSDLGMMARRNGDLTRSRELYLESLRLFQHLGLEAGQVDVIEGLSGTELAMNRPAAALRLLVVADRVRDRLPGPYLSQDRFEDRSATWKSAHAVLGTEAEAIVREASTVELAALVEKLLGVTPQDVVCAV